MTLLTFLGLLPALLGLLGDKPPAEQGVRRVWIREELIISVPVRPRPPQSIEWQEKRGPKCIGTGQLAGAMLSGPSSIDFVFRDRTRVRAEMDDECPALDFYRGFYLHPDDERICAKRETIRSRIGGSCRIERFRTLVPQIKR